MTQSSTAQSNIVSKKLQGQVAIVTGAGRGLGTAAAVLLAQAGAAVVCAARSVEQVEAVAAQITKDGGRAIGVAADVSDTLQVEEVVESALDQFGRVDLLLNNAAVVWPIEEVSEADPDEWAYNVHVNLVGPFAMARNVLPLMMAQKNGRILNISSGAASTAIRGMSAYCAAKAGLEMFTQVLAQEVAETPICVNCLRPGMVDTSMQSDIRSVDTDESTLDYSFWHEKHEQGQLSDPAQVAQHIYWLFGPWSRERSGDLFDSTDANWTAQVAADLSK